MEFKTPQEIHEEAFSEEEKIYRCGIEEIDDRVPFTMHQLVTIGGNSNTGKSFLAMNLLNGIQKYNDVAVCFVSIEMGLTVSYKRFLSLRSRIPLGLLKDRQDDARFEAAKLVFFSRKFILSEGPLEIDPLIEYMRVSHLEDGVKVFAIDFLQLVGGPFDEDYKRINYIMRELAKFRKEYEVCIILISQLTNQSGRDNNLFSPVAGFKGSGDIMYITDVGWVMNFLQVGKTIYKNVIGLVCVKNRHGESTSMFLKADFPIGSFSIFDPYSGPNPILDSSTQEKYEYA